MTYRFNDFVDRARNCLFLALAAHFAACASDVGPGEESSTLAATSSALVCGGYFSGEYGTINSYYPYAAQTIGSDCAPGANVSVQVNANEVPNRFRVRDATGATVADSQWLGYATYSSPWWVAPLSNNGTASLSFSNNNPPYSLVVETQTPPDGSYPHTSDEWNASSSCQCAPRHYICGYAKPYKGCDSWRTHLDITADDMTAAIATCRSTHPSDYTDFCYVIDHDGAAGSDASECTGTTPAGSWRSKNNCCNFNGTLSCPP